MVKRRASGERTSLPAGSSSGEPDGHGSDSPCPRSEADGEDMRLVREVLHVCDSIGQFIEWWGFKAIHGRIWTLLALHRDPMTQVEIAEFLGVSRSLVSTSMAELIEWDLVRPTASHRNAPYEANMDIWPVVSEVLRKREWMMMERTRLSLEGAIQQARHAEEHAGRETRFDPERMQALSNMTEMAQSILRLMMTIRVPKAGGGSMLGWLAKASALFNWLRGENPSAPPRELAEPPQEDAEQDNERGSVD